MSWQIGLSGLLVLLLSPVSGTGNADVNEAESVLGGLGEGDSRGPFALLVDALDALHPLQSGVLDAVLVDGKSDVVHLGAARHVVRLVHTVLPFVAFARLLEVATDPAVVDQSGDALVLVVSLLFGVQHVVALLAEPHALELVLRGLVTQVLLDGLLRRRVYLS